MFFEGTHRATPLQVGEVDVGDEQDRLGFEVGLWPQERDFIPSEAREQTAFQTYGWKVQFISVRLAVQEATTHRDGKVPAQGFPTEISVQRQNSAEPGLVLCCVLEGLPAETPTQSREVGY